MKVFISWSGDRSKAIAEALRDWIPKVIQSAEPWVSSQIPVGARWTEDIGKHLEESDFGVICLTPENLTEPWILFEAGALSKKLGKAKVCPYLFQLDHSDVKGPLVMFQAAKAEEEATRKLLESINASSESNLPDDRLKEAFDKWWPDLEERLKSIPDQPEERRPARSPEDMLEEVLELVRGLARRSPRGFEPKGTPVVEAMRFINPQGKEETIFFPTEEGLSDTFFRAALAKGFFTRSEAHPPKTPGHPPKVVATDGTEEDEGGK